MDPATFAENAAKVATQAQRLAEETAGLANQATQLAVDTTVATGGGEGGGFVFLLTVFALACVVGYYVVWHVTPALHSPLMSVTNAISSVIVVGALIATGASAFNASQVMGFLAVLLASINIFGGFIVTQRMLAMYKKRQK
jgi:NAD(P) transhydrogenase subunit alpha